MAPPTTGDPLEEVVHALTESRTAAQVVDADGRLVWASEQLLALAGAGPDDEVGLGDRVEDGPCGARCSRRRPGRPCARP